MEHQIAAIDMLKNKLFLFLFFFSVAFFLPIDAKAGVTPAFTIEFGKTETVYNWATQKCNATDIPDFEVKALVDAGGNVQLYSGSFPDNFKSIGPNLTDVTRSCTKLLASAPTDPNPRNYNTENWLMSPYTLDGTTIYALVHTEYHGDHFSNCNSTNWLQCWWNSVNLAKSTDAGNSFTEASSPNQNVANTSINYDPNNTVANLIGFGGSSNIIAKDGYYYSTVVKITPMAGTPVIYPDLGSSAYGVCMMRTNNLVDPASWKLWDGVGFNTPARGVPASGNCVPVIGAAGSLLYSTYLSRYFGVDAGRPGPTPGNFWGRITTMSDLTTTDRPFYWFTGPHYAEYYTFIQPGAETRNFEDIGRSPWLYYVACGPGENCTTGFADYNRNLVRVRVRFNTPQDTGKYDVLDLHFNEYKGTKTLDSSFYGNDGLLTSNVTFGQEGAAKFVRFSSTPGSIQVNDSPSLSVKTNITISARLRTTQQSTGYPPIVVKETTDNKLRNYGLFLNPAGKLFFSLTNGTALTASTSNKSINDGTWHDVRVSFTDATGDVQFVIDGQLDSTVHTGGRLSEGLNTAPIQISWGAFVGDVDHLTIYNYLLPVPASTIKPGDLNSDGKVDINDYNLLKTNFGKPYTIFDYNGLVGNYGK